MNKRQKKKYTKKWVNTSAMFITAKRLVYHRIKHYYKLQKFMKKMLIEETDYGRVYKYSKVYR